VEIFVVLPAVLNDTLTLTLPDKAFIYFGVIEVALIGDPSLSNTKK